MLKNITPKTFKDWFRARIFVTMRVSNFTVLLKKNKQKFTYDVSVSLHLVVSLS